MNTPREPISHGRGHNVGCVLLHEVAGSGNCHQGEILLDQIPGAVESTGQQGLITQPVKLEHCNRDLGQGRRRQGWRSKRCLFFSCRLPRRDGASIADA